MDSTDALSRSRCRERRLNNRSDSSLLKLNAFPFGMFDVRTVELLLKITVSESTYR